MRGQVGVVAAEGVAEVTGQSPRHHQDDVEAAIEVGVPGPAGDPQIGGGEDAGARARRHRVERRLGGGARLDLDEDQGAAAPRDDVDLAAVAAESAIENRMALQAQEPDGDGLGGEAEGFRPAAFLDRPFPHGVPSLSFASARSSSARA